MSTMLPLQHGQLQVLHLYVTLGIGPLVDWTVNPKIYIKHYVSEDYQNETNKCSRVLTSCKIQMQLKFHVER